MISRMSSGRRPSRRLALLRKRTSSRRGQRGAQRPPPVLPLDQGQGGTPHVRAARQRARSRAAAAARGRRHGPLAGAWQQPDCTPTTCEQLV